MLRLLKTKAINIFMTYSFLCSAFSSGDVVIDDDLDILGCGDGGSGSVIAWGSLQRGRREREGRRK